NVHDRQPRLGASRVIPMLMVLSLSGGASRAHTQALPSTPVAAPAVAESIQEDPQSRWETQSVREWMQEDLRVALQPRPDVAAGASLANAGLGVRPVLEPRLVALYGVGAALMAEVQVGRQAYLYVRGQAWPAGHVGDRGVYQLRGMNGACVQLERGQDRHSLCLRMLLGEARP